MRTDKSSLIKRLEVCEACLEMDNLWPGARIGFKREITRIRGQILNIKRTEAGDHNDKIRKKHGR